MLMIKEVKFMRFKWLSLLILLWWFNTGEVNTVFQSEAPADKAAPQFTVGQWVKYQVKRYSKESDEDKPRDLSEAELKISIVDKQVIDEQEYFWLEFLVNEGKEQQRVVKFMIDRTGKPYPAKIILKYGDLNAVEIELRRWAVRTRLAEAVLFEEMTRGLTIIPFTRSQQSGEKVTREKLSITLGERQRELECTKVSITRVRAKMRGHIWYSDKVPLAGLVKFFLTRERFRTFFLLVDYGDSGGSSVITETPKNLNFRE